MLKQQYFHDASHPKPELKKYIIAPQNTKYMELIDIFNEEYIKSMCGLDKIKEIIDDLNCNEKMKYPIPNDKKLKNIAPFKCAFIASKLKSIVMCTSEYL